MSQENKEKEKAKNVRRAGKSALTRALNTGKMMMQAKRSPAEMHASVKDVKTAYDNLGRKHDEYTMYLDDTEYDEAENWMEQCTREYTEFMITVNDYENKETPPGPEQQDVPEDFPDLETESIEQNSATQNDEKKDDETTSGLHKPHVLKHEKPKLPQFLGDVRKYFIFKADFQHAIESHCSDRDAITILRSCLGPEPSKLVEGISTDLKVMWQYLVCVTIISDTITGDLEKFKPIQGEEDNRFCDLVNLVRRSYNILKEINRPQDINNSHVISLIERKMTKDDIKVWARHIHVQKLEPSMENLLKWMEDEMTARLRSGATIRKIRSAVGTVTQSKNSFGNKTPCYVCKEVHCIDECPKFLSMSINERWKIVKEQRACFSCLKRSKGHTATNCLRKRECPERRQDGSLCKKPHHKLLHMEEVNPHNRAPVTCVQDDSQVLLPTLSAKVKGKNGEATEANVFYDSGAQVSMIRSSYAESLNLESKPIRIVITKVGGAEEDMSTSIYKVPVCTNDGRMVQTIDAIGIPKISEDTPDANIHYLSTVLGISSDKLKRKAGPIDLLVGINYSRFHVGETKVRNSLVARNSPLGWVVFGSNAEGVMPDLKQILHIRVATPVDLTSFWTTESMGVAASPCTCKEAEMSAAERAVLNEIEESCQLQNGKWTMKYPWKRNPQSLPNNYPQVIKKLETTERRLANQPKYASSYDEQIKEMENLGFARKLTENEIKEWKGPVHYISHHAVLRPEKKSTPVRIVFNSSASFNGHCLNDYWHKGPDLLNNLFGVLLRFRENAVAVFGDIAKMYHMIGITPPDQHVHRFLWRSFETDRKPDTYVKTVLTFGDRPSPTMAITAMHKTAELNKESQPAAAEAIINNAYVDDICDSVCSTDEANNLTTDIDEVLHSGGFHVKNWIKNGETNAENSDEIVLGNNEEAEKVLGTVWNPDTDEFSFKIKDQLAKASPAVKDTDAPQSTKLTKRRILSQLAGIFDPIGVAAAIIVKSKIAMQELWQLGVGWDDDIPTEEQRKWLKLFQEISALNNVKFPRCLTPSGTIGNPTLIIFCDASRLAFGTCAYVRWKLFEGNFGVRFVAARSRVAPLKELTIPRLELQAAVLASRLGKTVINESRLVFEAVVYFSDSRVVLAWIKGQPRSYKPFVSSRISEIQSNSKPDEWLHCPTHLNVADDVTKGISSEEINGRWLNGPEFLKLPTDHWPMEQDVPNMSEVNKERRKIRITCATTIAEPVIKCEVFSKWRRLLRVTAYVLRFCRNIRIKSTRDEGDDKIDIGPLKPEEIERSEEYWLKIAQATLAKKMKDGELKALTAKELFESAVAQIHPWCLMAKHIQLYFQINIGYQY
jgi:hypothetical protein